MKVAIIIPAYNEENRIGRTLDAYLSFFSKVGGERGFDYQLIIVINGTRDRTEDVIIEYKKKHRHIEYLNFKKGGKGFAITEGFKEALRSDFDLIGFVDADMATPPEEYFKLLENLSSFDGVIADRYLPTSQINPPYSFRRSIVSVTYRFIVKSFFRLKQKDTQCGAKIFRKEVIKKLLPELVLTNWSFEVHLLYLAKIYGFRIKSIPTIWYEIEGGHLNVMKTSIQMFSALIQLRIMRTPFRRTLKVISPLIGITYKVIRGN